MNENNELDFINEMEKLSAENQNIPFKHYEFCILGSTKNKGTHFTKLVIVNRWLWMTDDSHLRNLFAPLKEKLSNEAFIENTPSILYVAKNKKDVIKYLTELGIRYNENLSRSLAISQHIMK